MPRLRLTAQLLVLSLLIVTVPLLLAAFLLPERIAGQMIQKGQAELRHSAEELATFVSNDFLRFKEELEVSAKERIYQEILLVSHEGIVSAADRERLLRGWGDIDAHITPGFLALFLVDAEGRVIIHLDRQGRDIAVPSDLERGASFSEKLKQATAFCMSDARMEIGGKDPAILLGAPVRDGEGRVVGHLVLRASLGSTCGIIANSNLGNGSYGFAIDERGMLVAHPDPERELRLNFREVASAKPLWEEMLKGESGVRSYVSSKGIQKVAGFAPVPICGWSVAMSMNDADFYAMSKQVRKWILWLAGACAVLAVASSLYIAQAFRQKQKALQAQHELREQLMQTQKVLTLGQLSGGVAHDFNNILGAVQLQLSVLGTVQKLNDEALKVIQECSKTIDSGSELTTQLLNFSRKNPVQKHTLELASVLRDNAAMLQRLLGSRYSLLWRATPEDLKVVADHGMLQQVILNLVLNARDAMPEGGGVRIEARPIRLQAPREGITRFVRIDVSDEGTGMPPDVKARLFEPFFTTKTAGKGTGLGLSTTMRIVRDHQGWIEVDSVVGKGSRFSVFLPEA